MGCDQVQATGQEDEIGWLHGVNVSVVRSKRLFYPSSAVTVFQFSQYQEKTQEKKDERRKKKVRMRKMRARSRKSI